MRPKNELPDESHIEAFADTTYNWDYTEALILFCFYYWDYRHDKSIIYGFVNAYEKGGIKRIKKIAYIRLKAK